MARGGRWRRLWRVRLARATSRRRGARVAVGETRAMRTYGNWRRPMSAGLGALGTIGTAALLVGLIVVIVALMFAGLLAALAIAVVGAVGVGSLSVRNRHGRTLLQAAATRVGWARACVSGAHVYRSGPLGHTGWGSFQLPGLAAGSTLSEGRDAYDRPFALVRVPATGHFT